MALPLLLVFIQFSRDDPYATLRNSEVLIRQTYVFQVTVLALLNTIKMGVDTLSCTLPIILYMDLGMLFITIGGATYSYSKAMELISSRSLMKNEAHRLLEEKVAANIDFSVDTKIGNDLLFKELANLRLDFLFHTLNRWERQTYVPLNLKTKGYISDIDLERLGDFVENLLKEQDPSAAALNTLDIVSGRRSFSRAKNVLYLSKRFRDSVRENGQILFIDRTKFKHLDVAALERKVQKIFYVSPETNSQEELRQELALLRNSIIRAIKEGRSDIVEEELGTYVTLGRVFLNRLRPFMEPYNRDRATKEISLFGGGWEEIEWIQKDFTEILNESLAKENVDIIRHVMIFPIRLALVGLEEEDYYLFHKFTLWIPAYTYRTSQSIKSIEVKQFVIKKSWRYLQEFSDLYISSYLDRARSEAGIDAIEDISLGVILAFQNLIKTSFDNSDFDAVKQFVGGLNDCFAHIVRDYLPDVSEIEAQLENPELGEADKSLMEGELRLRRRTIQLTDTLDSVRKQLKFGFAAWMFRAYRDGKVRPEDWRSSHSSLLVPSTPAELFQLLVKCLETKTENFFGWTWWYLEQNKTSDKGAVTAYHSDGYLLDYCCYRILEYLKNLNPGQRAACSLPANSATRSTLTALASTARQIQTDSTNWSRFLEAEMTAVLNDLVRMCDEAVVRGQEIEIEELIKANLDVGKVADFKSQFLIGFQKHSQMRLIVKELKAYIAPQEHAPAGLGYYGVHQIEDKSCFAEGNFTPIYGLGEEFGKLLGETENDVILQKIATALVTHKQRVEDASSIVPVLDEVLDKLRAKQLMPAIFVLRSWSAIVAIQEAGKDFERNKQPREGHPLRGTYKGYPVYNLYSRISNVMLVVDLKAMGEWKQYIPKQELLGEEFLGEVHTFYLKPFTEESAKQLIDKQPEFKKDAETGADLTEHDAIRRLRQRVHLRILQQFEFVSHRIDAGEKILLNKDL